MIKELWTEFKLGAVAYFKIAAIVIGLSALLVIGSYAEVIR